MLLELFEFTCAELAPLGLGFGEGEGVGFVIDVLIRARAFRARGGEGGV